MSRKFDLGRQSEVLYNEELFKLFEILKNVSDLPVDTGTGPVTDREGALWIDRSNKSADLKYYDSNSWNLLFADRFRMTGEILSSTEPKSPINGQLWLNKGTLTYFDGFQWTAVKADTLDENFNVASYEKFLYINPLHPVGDPIVQDNNLTLQYVVPSVAMDKFFIQGAFNDQYTKVHESAIQIPAALTKNTIPSLTHVNPDFLIGIEKKLIKIDSSTRDIYVPELNTEFYAFRTGNILTNGSEIIKDDEGNYVYVHSGGKLLLKEFGTNSEYESIPSGIRLSENIVNSYDFILSVTYKFGSAKNKGRLQRGRRELDGGDNSLYIGVVKKDFEVFVDGLLLKKHFDNYTYDSLKGFLNLKNVKPINKEQLSLGILTFPRATNASSVYVSSVNDKDEGIINIGTETFTKPFLFVNGVALNSTLGDFYFDLEDEGIIYVKNAHIGMECSIVETYDKDTGFEMFVKEGRTTENKIHCTLTELPLDVEPILFVDGIKVDNKDIVRNSDNSITAANLKAGLGFTLLKAKPEDIIFDDGISNITIPTDSLDGSLVFMDDRLLCDKNTVIVSKLPNKATHGEIKRLVTGMTDSWYFYNEPDLSWKPLTDFSDADILKSLNTITEGYSTTKKSINILQESENSILNYFVYSYANSVEEELQVGEIDTDENKDFYKVAFNHIYPTNKNALAIWLNGVRQYNVIEKDMSTFEFKTNSNQKLFYRIEKPESFETISCRRQILTSKDAHQTASNVYKTNIFLMPGVVQVFIGGIKQSSSAYRIIDPQTILFTEDLIGGNNNFPDDQVLTKDGVVSITRKIQDEILIEVRDDYSLQEVTLPVLYPGQKEFNIYYDNLPSSILDTKDFVMIYINGLAYGSDYYIDKDRGSIVLTNQDITNLLGYDRLKQYLESNPAAYKKWKEENNLNSYPEKPITDKITFEWR